MNVLKTDKYELTMLEALILDGRADNRAVFELFGRKLPAGRDYGVVAGTERAIKAIEDFVFTDEDIQYLSTFLNEETITYLRNYKFKGTVRGYREGDYWFPYAPLLTIEGTLGDSVILETILLSIFNYDSAVASAASHIRRSAGTEAHLMEFGARRVNEFAAVVASRAAYIGGFDATSNLEAGKAYSVPVYGTSAHAFTLTYPTEKEAFTAQVKAFGAGTTLLVDTYDIEEGVANAVEVAGTELGAVRIDSGDPLVVIPAVRAQLDALGAVNTKIVLSGDVDRELLETLKETGIHADSYGIGTSVVTGDGAVASGFVYKLVEVEQNGVMVPVAKKSAGGKKSMGGAKTSYRVVNEDGTWTEVHITGRNVDALPEGAVPAQVVYLEKGDIRYFANTAAAKELHRALNVAVPYPKVTVVVDGVEAWNN